MTDPAFKLLFKKSYAHCVQQLQYLTSSKEDAEELFIEAITKYWIKSKKDNAKDIKYPKKYILIIAKHIWYDQNKKKRPEQISDEDQLSIHQSKHIDVFDENVFNKLIQKENEEISKREHQKRKVALNRAFKKLKPNCRKLLLAIFTYNKNNQELQKELNYASVNVIKTTKYRCKNQLKKIYLKEYNQIGG
ncbi:MAG: RNA polymerase sigma factor [Chitinophagales bacterium]